MLREGSEAVKVSILDSAVTDVVRSAVSANLLARLLRMNSGV